MQTHPKLRQVEGILRFVNCHKSAGHSSPLVHRCSTRERSYPHFERSRIRFEDMYLFSFGTGGDDDVFSDNVGQHFLMPVPVGKVMEILNEMFRFRRLLATPKSVNVEGGVEEMRSATAIHVMFHSIKRQHTKMELDMTQGWHEDQSSQ